MYADADVKVKSDIIGPIRVSDSDDDMDFALKIGLGADYLLNDNIFLNLEGNYTLGVDDLEDIRYFHFILGAAYRF